MNKFPVWGMLGDCLLMEYKRKNVPAPKTEQSRTDSGNMGKKCYIGSRKNSKSNNKSNKVI